MNKEQEQMDGKMKIGLRIQQQRLLHGHSQEALANLLDVSRQSVSKWELGKALPDIDKIIQLSQLWNISCDELLLDQTPDLLEPSEHILNWGMYLVVKDIRKSIRFYEKLLHRRATVLGPGRFAQFRFNGNCILSILNEAHQREINLGKAKDYKFVLNLWTTDLSKEFHRIKKLNIGPFTDIASAHPSYYYFTLVDPDYNLIEITGEYHEAGILPSDS